MDDVGMWLLLVRNGTTWEEVMRSPAARVQETGGPTNLAIGAIADGDVVKRAGAALGIAAVSEAGE